MTTCLTCKHWDAKGVSRELFRVCLVFCVVNNTMAVTLAHWRSCGVWSAAADAVVSERVEWLKRNGDTPRVGSLPCASGAGHSLRVLGLLPDFPKGVVW